MTATDHVPAVLSLELYRRELVGKPCRPVDKTDDVLPLIDRMVLFARVHGGVGLAAPQIGVYIQLAIAIIAPGVTEALINPEITNLAGRDLFEAEGCLSLPPYGQATARVWRSETVHIVTGCVQEPEARMARVYTGAAARIVQHEIDHLNGIYFIDHCGPVAKGIVLRRFNQFLRQQGAEREQLAYG